MSFNLDAGGLNSHSMDDLAKKHLDHQCIAFKDVCGSGQKQIKFNQVPLDRATEYAAEDADVTLRLWTRFKTRLPHERVARVYEMVDRPLVPVVARMEREGVKVDREELNKLSQRIPDPDRRARGKGLRRGRLHRSPSAARSNWARSCSARWA